MLIDDEWSGLADLLANLIAKYAYELSIDDMQLLIIKRIIAVMKRSS